ncbi:MAG: PQQ-dependent dehydrogenase, methanol/ethanol family [Gemmatimonadetes bacterium]|nr:PQQ-dependent dehydrogenase, methanol/ethanol family [Gemmatimonadota bacterium]
MMQRPLRKDRSSKDRSLVIALLASLAAVVMPLELVAGLQAGQQSGGPGALALQEAAPAEWLSYGRDQAETHYSPLDQINSDNVDRLGLAWSWEIPKTGARLETTPLVSDGVMYATGAHSFVFALDARTGEKIWQWDPGIPDERNGGPSVCCGDVNRGLAIYENHVFAGLLDGRLVALNKETGLVEWVQQTTPPGQDYSITGAPRIAAGNVIIGNGGAEYGIRGFVTAYDTETGRQAWRTYTVPGNPADGFESEAMRVAAETWFGEWWVVGGGGSAWDTFAFDAEANLVYVGTGNGAPWSRDIRSPGGGDNLYLSSILALNADDGELVWYYQTTPGDDWDYTATQPMMLLDLTIDGRERKVIVQAPKNGFFFVIDRLTGEFISGEAYADDVTWASGIDQATGRPIETPEARYGMNRQGAYLSPGPTGAHNWRPMSWNPTTGLVYLPVQNTQSYYEMVTDFRYTLGQWNTGTTIRGGGGPRPDRPELTGPRTLLSARDPATNTEVWRVPSEGAGAGNGGTMSTGGNLVFRGSGNQLIVHDATTGAVLWQTEIGGGTATPMTYSLDGVQYVSIAGGSTREGPRMWTFVLDGTAERPGGN